MRLVKNSIKILSFAIILTGIVCWLLAFIRCEYLTVRYGEQFADAYREHTMIAKPDYLKILRYTENYAEVYYVKKGAGGNVLSFGRTDAQGEWFFVEWETIWSRSGSASDFVWPYIR